MVAAALIRAHRADLQELIRLAQRDLEVFFSRFSTADEARDGLLEVLPALVEVYGSAAASLAADWYEDLREAEQVRGRFRAEVADLPDRSRTDALARWSVGVLYGPDVKFDIAYSLAAGGLQRIIANASRYTVTRSAIRDRQADGWQRVGFGEDCAFCTMLVARGAVYEEATVDFASHDNCDCAAVPAFGGRERPVKPYQPTERRISDADRARVREYLRTS